MVGREAFASHVGKRDSVSSAPLQFGGALGIPLAVPAVRAATTV